MQKSLGRWRIIAVLLAAFVLAGCTALRLGYSQGPSLAYWWLDGYVEVNAAQQHPVKEQIGEWFRWHRSHQLPEIAVLLQRAQVEVMNASTPAAFCGWYAEGRKRADVSLKEAVPAIAVFMRTLTPEQVTNLERKFAKSNKEFRADHLQRDPAERRKAAFKRVRDRIEMMYGRLDERQRDFLATSMAASPFDPERWNAERLARQQDILQVVRQVVASPQMPVAQVQVLVEGLGQRLLHSPHPEYRAYQDRLAEYHCAMTAELHNGASRAQREHARAKLHGWENDVRALMAPPA